MDEDIGKMTPEEQFQYIMEQMEKWPEADRDAFLEVLMWFSTERPKDDEPMSYERLSRLIKEVKQRKLNEARGGETAKIYDIKSKKPDQGPRGN